MGTRRIPDKSALAVESERDPFIPDPETVLPEAWAARLAAGSTTTIENNYAEIATSPRTPSHDEEW